MAASGSGGAPVIASVPTVAPRVKKAALHPYAARLPKFACSGSFFDEKKAARDHTRLTTIVNGCFKNRDNIDICFDAITEAEAQRVSSTCVGNPDELFCPAVRNVMGLPDSFIYPWLDANTDVKPDKALTLLAADPKGPHRLFCACTQLPEQMRFDDELQNVNVFTRIANECFVHHGQRNADIVANGGLDKGKVFYKSHGAYLAGYDKTTHKLATLLHVSTNTSGTIPAGIYIDKTWGIIDNGYDMKAEFQQADGEPGKKLHSFFKKSPPEGPHTKTFFSGSKTKGFMELVDKHYAAYENDKVKVGTVKPKAEEIKQLVTEKKTELGKTTVAKMKLAAKAALEVAKKRRVASDK
jgi:hypothetical protein